MQSIFRSEPEVLNRGLFTLYGARQGARTVLNVNFLPDLLHYIKQHLTSQQILRLQDYHLQNYLVELSIGYGGKPDLASLLDQILDHIRGNNHFWYRHNNQQVIDEEQQLKHTAIHQYHKDMAVLREDFKQEQTLMEVFTPEYTRRTSAGFCFRILHSTSEPYFGTRHCLNHIAYIPSFLMKKYSQSIQQQTHQLPNLQLTQQQKLKLVRQCIIFLLSNKQSQASLKAKESSGSSENGEGEKSNEQSLSSPEQQNSQHRSIMDEFLEFIEKIPVLPTFHNSHHMHSLTYNILQIAHKVITLSEISQAGEGEGQLKKEVGHNEVIEVIQLPKDSKQVLSSLSDRELQQSQCEMLAVTFLKHWSKILSSIDKELKEKQKDSERGWLDSPQKIAAIKQSYQQMLVKPQFLEMTNYKAHGTGVSWKEEDYLRFLKGLAEYMNIPTNNKKIAAFMGEGIQPNHVKHVKGLYLTAMKDRMEAGECGGGKRGKCLSKTQFLERDIASFSIRYFEKNKKIRKRKPKRKRKNSFSDQFEDDADSQY